MKSSQPKPFYRMQHVQRGMYKQNSTAVNEWKKKIGIKPCTTHKIMLGNWLSSLKKRAYFSVYSDISLKYFIMFMCIDLICQNLYHRQSIT